MLIDHHTHTVPYSFDARQAGLELLEAAANRHLAGVCLTEHYEKDVSYIAGEEAIFNLDRYARTVRDLQARGEQLGIRVLYGIELGYLPHLDKLYGRLALRYPFDTIIMSLHILDGEDPYSDQAIYRRGRQHVYGRYLDMLAHMVDACPDWDILGHFDYISRYAPWENRKLSFSEQPDRFDHLLQRLVAAGKTLEINTATVRVLRDSGYSKADAWPDPAILARYRTLGGDRVCLSSDAHDVKTVGKLLPEGLDWLRAQGFSHITRIEKRQAVMTSI